MKKKIILDILLNIIASLLPLFILQFLILPNIAKNVSVEYYGLLLSLIALLNFSAGTIGSVINNVRLIRYHEITINNNDGDFNTLAAYLCLLNCFIVAIGYIFISKEFDFISLVFILIISVFVMLSSYMFSEFRIRLDYVQILIHNLILISGYIFGFYLFKLTQQWLYVLFFGSIFAFTHVLFKTRLLFKPFTKSFLFKKSLFETLFFLTSSLLLSAGSQIDKIMIFPILGGVAVSEYYVSSLLGKTLALGMGPLTGVLLSYLAKMSFLSKKNGLILLYASYSLGILFYFLVVLINGIFIEFLYPQFLLGALKLSNITSLAAITIIVTNILNSALLKFNSTRMQITINSIYIALYFLISVSLTVFFGIIGFSYGVLIAALARLLMVTYYYKKSF